MTMQAQEQVQLADDDAKQSETSALGALGQDLRGLYELLVLASRKALSGHFERSALVEQAYSIGNGSMLFVTVTMMVVGMITVVQSGLQTQRVIPELSLLGANIIQILAREFAPTVCALMLATRVGAGIAAEIGSMVVTDQVDALRMSGADPIDYLVVPRLIASIVMTTALAYWALFVSLLAGTLAANMVFDLNYSTFVNFNLVGGGDFIVMTLKSLCYGIAIPIVSARRGLTTFGGSEGVGWATTNAVVHSSLAIIILDLILSIFGYVVFPPV
jgi:phospholipid/cholesterol/gamma-HCH transport system permease protein